MFDYGIINGLVVDGTGNTPRKAAVYIRDDKIAVVCEDALLPCREVIDADGLVVSPGFMDLHTHSDATPYCASGFESALAQGITFHLAGNCGISLVPNREKNHDLECVDSRQRFLNGLHGEEYRANDVASYYEEIGQRGFAINFATLIGYAAIRNTVMEDPSSEQPSAEELKRMTELVDQQMEQGAMGLSLGLTYVPCTYAQTPELIAVARVVAKHQGVLTAHMRSESEEVFQALEEMEQIAKETGVQIQVSHLKLLYAKQWGQVDKLLGHIDRMRAEGVKVNCDQYPYCASSTDLLSMVPAWGKHGGKVNATKRLMDDELYRKMRPQVEADIQRRGGASCVGIAYTDGVLPQCDGKTLLEAARLLDMEPVDACRKILVDTECRAQAIFYAIDEKDMLAIAARMDVAVGSDGFGFDFNVDGGPGGKTHPRSAGSFARFLRVVREHNLMPIEKAVYKMTGLPAAILNLNDRGRLEQGCFADIAIFDPEIISDQATFDEPTRPACGVHAVFVNGKMAYRDGTYLERKAGRILLRPR